MHSSWQDLAWDCYTSFFANLYQRYDPWFAPKFRFCSISWEQMHRISANFIYAFILTRSTLGLLHIIFHTIVLELWPLIYSKISFPLKILRTNGQILIKLFITIYTDKIYVGIVSCHFSQIWRHETGLSPPVKYFYWQFEGGSSFVDHLCYLCLDILTVDCIDSWSLPPFLLCVHTKQAYLLLKTILNLFEPLSSWCQFWSILRRSSCLDWLIFSVERLSIISSIFCLRPVLP